ncbi:transcription activator effector-binding protein [Subsaximicrobium wynnwilliamsii]|uniref:Transcription activator effector-binding protein n=1 Tax=Subsaximicrobium wynnwilliamsii TaxID=291179 RepID=A0A5C6ZAE3_9FLAO|nr:transcription activator effector-binding protein [Subsaximicrobium wynnwilliamsii]TXD82022.1 transcription activator effector-binding protein [Subsaximicrobium wynnwilliamsii]TXD86900.1 transcription activator effector-binding protein [Subsaximicrobium wynnwilliamsii]TXE01482.1 transcription activator effector-binding protein [Subsaximicrobium wynnwilliamsii]
MKAFKYLFFLLLIFVIGFAIYIAVQPNEYNFSRSKIIKAPLPVVFEKVSDYEDWTTWEGKHLRIAAIETIASEENQSITQQFQLSSPLENKATMRYSFEPVPEGTQITWQVEGKYDFANKLNIAMSGKLEDAIAPDLEEGLDRLDRIVRAEMKKYSISIDGITQHSGGFYLYTTGSVKMDDFTNKRETMIAKIKDYAIANAVSMAGPAFVMYLKKDELNDAVIFSACVPTTSQVMSSESDILTGQLEPFKAVKTTLKGDYQYLEEARLKTFNYIEKNELVPLPDGPQLDVFINDSKSVPNPAAWLTEIYIAIE